MNASVIITSSNEQRDLEVTVAMAWASCPPAHEVIVVDDASDEPVDKRLSSFPDVRVVRNDKRIGVAPSRNVGAVHATGDILVFLDSHMRMPLDWLHYVENAVTLFPNAIMCTVCRGFDVRSKFISCGARFNTQNNIVLGRSWLDRGPVDTIDMCPCLLGAAYVVPRHIWEALAGIHRCFVGWGYTEQDLSLRAWMFGYEVRRINGLVVPHRFNRGLKDVSVKGPWPSYNAIVAAATYFEDGVFERSYLPFVRKLMPCSAWKEFRKRHDAVMKFREFVQSKRVYNDAELDGLCGLKIPTPAHQRLVMERLLYDKAKTLSDKQPTDSGNASTDYSRQLMESEHDLAARAREANGVVV